MERILNTETVRYMGKRARIAGWVNSRRDHGGIVFLDIRDRSGMLQVVCSQKLAKDIKDEDVLEIEGEIKERPKNMINPELETGKIELKVETIKVLAEADNLPFDLKDLKMSLPTLLDYRPLTLRNKKIKAIFKIQEEIISSFRKTMKSMDFTEFYPPTIVPTATEGGAEVFRIDYFNHDAYLAQSPQLYKQIMVSIFERAFTITHAYRAEPSVTTRHITEYISLDAEMGFISTWEELMDTCEAIIFNMLSDIKNNCKKELKTINVEISELNSKIPRIKMRDAQEIIFKRTKRDNRKAPDLEPEDEREICAWAKEEHKSDFVFITHYPTKKRPFYTFPDPENPEYTLSFDLLYKGLEIVTGGQRIHDYEMLVKNIKKWGNKIKDFKLYLQAFQYGMPPEGGFALGAERIVKQILGLENVKEASLFPRDMGRIDQRLALTQPKKKLGKGKKNLKK
jgi:nondiscriminating aspartyl-tRNA synthetase